MPQAKNPFPLPLPYALLSGATDRWRKKLIKNRPDDLLRRIERWTGLADWGEDRGFSERYAESMASIDAVDFNLVGRLAVKTMMEWHLMNRLHTVEMLKRHPEVGEIEVKAPIFIVGLFRTGTTFLHNVMGADPALRAGFCWEHCYPVGRPRAPLADIGWRRRKTAYPLWLNHTVVPDQDVVHYVDIDEFEEDFFLLGSDMALMTNILGLGDFDYAWRLLNWDMEEPYRWHKYGLQALWAQRSAEHWLLKCPWHLWNLEAVLKVYPDARIIHTHRDIAKTIGSECSLNARIMCRMQREVDLHEVGRFWVDYSRAGLERGQAVKDSLPAEQVYDVRLKDLHGNSDETIRDIYRHFDLDHDDRLIAKLVARAAKEPPQQFGIHEYEYSDYGLNPVALREQFSDYRAKFGV